MQVADGVAAGGAKKLSVEVHFGGGLPMFRLQVAPGLLLLLLSVFPLQADPLADLNTAYQNAVTAVQTYQSDVATDLANAAALASAQQAKATSAAAVQTDAAVVQTAQQTLDAAFAAILNAPALSGSSADTKGPPLAGPAPHFDPPHPYDHGGLGPDWHPNPFNIAPYIAPVIVNYATQPRSILNPNTGTYQMMTPGEWVAAPAGSGLAYVWQPLPAWPLLGAAAKTGGYEEIGGEFKWCNKPSGEEHPKLPHPGCRIAKWFSDHRPHVLIK